MTIGERIVKRRKELGLTQTELAKRMGYSSKSSICNVENDKEQNLTLDRVTLFAKALGVSESYLMGWNDSEVNAINASAKLMDGSDVLLTELVDIYMRIPEARKNQLLNIARTFL